MFLNDLRELESTRKAFSWIGRFFGTPAFNGNALKESLLKDGVNAGSIFSTFLICFCTEVDEPLMWRVYTANGGYAIGFKRDELVENIVVENQFDFYHSKCDYIGASEAFYAANEVEFEARFQELQGRSPKQPTESGKAGNKEIAEIFGSILHSGENLVFSKDSFFKSENEYRFAFTKKGILEGNDFSVINGIPRIEVKFKKPLSEMVTEILVSPLGDSTQNYQLAKLLATTMGIGSKNVKLFRCPVRR